MWVALIEKAYAKMHGCYGNLISGYIDEGIQELTGFQPEKVLIRNETSGVFPHKMIEQHYGGKDGFWDFLKNRRMDNCLLGCSIKNDKGGPQVVEGRPTGLIMNHAYGISDVMELPDPYDKSWPLRLMRLRNPWGNSEWLGEWSGDSEEMQKYRKTLEAYIQTLAPDEQFDLDADDGTFIMHFRQWRDNFSTLFINNDFPEDWTGVRFKSAWTPAASGGLPASYTKEALERYAKNPQFLVRPVKDCEVMFSMTQTGGRLPVSKYQYSKYPFADTMHYACVAVFRLPYGATYLTAFDKNAITYLSPIKRERENPGRCQLKGGETYVIVPSTEIAGKQGEVYISLYCNLALRDIEIKRVFHPSDTDSKESRLPKFIPEEAEKISNRAPTWKKILVKESLPYMMTDEDPGQN